MSSFSVSYRIIRLTLCRPTCLLDDPRLSNLLLLCLADFSGLRISDASDIAQIDRYLSGGDRNASAHGQGKPLWDTPVSSNDPESHGACNDRHQDVDDQGHLPVDVLIGDFIDIVNTRLAMVGIGVERGSGSVREALIEGLLFRERIYHALVLSLFFLLTKSSHESFVFWRLGQVLSYIVASSPTLYLQAQASVAVAPGRPQHPSKAYPNAIRWAERC